MRRRGAAAALVGSAALWLLPARASVPDEPAFTARVFLSYGLVDADAVTPLGRVVIGLFGGAVPVSADRFLRLLMTSYLGSSLSSVRPGEYVAGGFDAAVPSDFPRGNSEAVLQSAFELTHRRPGTVSLALSGADDERPVAARAATGYRITTGPGPAPSLDGKDIVIGRVLEGMDTVAALARLPTYAPQADSPLRTYNALASALGDGRGAKARTAWSKPRVRVIVTDCGVLQRRG